MSSDPDIAPKLERTLTLSVPRVELKLYRSSRTSSNAIKQPPHFEYIVRCQWSDAQAQGSTEYWWDSLPQTYTLRRRWLDIVRFHEVLVSHLTLDAQGYRNVKAKDPKLPA